MNSESSIPTPYVYDAAVKDEWLDENGHMNVAYYMTALDDGSEVLFADPGIGWEYTRKKVGTVFVVSNKVDYLRELHAGQAFRVTSRLLDFNQKMLHVYFEILNAHENLCARAEVLYIHVSFSTRKSSAMPEAVMQRLKTIHEAHNKLPVPAGLGSGIGIQRA
ncbi:MAG: thioesterase family protein [Pseudomonadota bacterium]